MPRTRSAPNKRFPPARRSGSLKRRLPVFRLPFHRAAKAA
ncbi:hypothetical protein GCWU000324_00123 [Kingella oralis ATCC 51147]|uniref:Uncharacterized protein n=1 Tax=Kingella oralis ATCC 51147 TaxID=629741 RepID=C4GEN6_9NEIS|nr:hypothetical protein GCWU000324_00123 [Kingella oralis ATCC 51147]